MNKEINTELSTMEQLIISNVNDDTKEFVKSIKEYISNITSLINIEDLYVDLITVEVDGEMFTLNDKFIDEISGKDIIAGHFDEALNRMHSSKVVKIFTSYACAYGENSNYGYKHMANYLVRGIKEHVSYKCLESCEGAPEVKLYRFGVFDNLVVDETLQCTSAFDLVEDIKNWYSNDFNYHIKVPSDSDEFLLEELVGYIQKIEELCEDYDEDEVITTIKKEDSFYYIGVQSPIECGHEVLKTINAYANEINVLIAKLEGTFKLSGKFIPDNSHVFATASIVKEENKFVLKAVRT